MSAVPRELGIVGLGRIGDGLALQALEEGIWDVGCTLGGARRELTDARPSPAPER